MMNNPMDTNQILFSNAILKLSLSFREVKSNTCFLEEETKMFGDIGLALTLYSFLPELNNMEAFT